MRILAILGLGVLVATGCASSETTDDGLPGNSIGGSGASDASVGGSAGSAGSGGSSGTGGSTAGTGGATGGSGGSSGTAGSGGGGTGGTSTGGNAGTAGTGAGGSSGTGGGTGGTGGTGTSGTGGTSTGGTGGGTGGPCTTDVDCTNGWTCQVLPNATQTALELQCAPIVGPNGTGVPCASNADCRSGQCITGECSAPCLSSSDCTQAGTCQSESITVGALTGSFDMCVVEPCDSTTDCDPGEYCSQLQSESGQLVAYCRAGNAGGSPTGDPCANSAACASLNCPDWLGFCTEMCSSDSDCVGTSPQACVDVFNNGSSFAAACAPACDSAADCAGAVCQIATDTNDDQHQFICGTGYGTDPVGSDCSTTNNCASGLCLQNYLNGSLVDAICTSPCDTGADCPAGYQVCTDVQMGTPSGSGTQIMGLCNHP